MNAVSSHRRGKSDRMRLAGWVNVVLSVALVYFATDKVSALLVAFFWIVGVFAVTHTIAWYWDRKPDRELERSTL